MPVEFALRPRIRLREGFAPPKRRWRLRLPRFTPHVLAYWALIGGICYAVVRSHDSSPRESAAVQASAIDPRTAALTTQADPAPAAEPALAADPAPAAELAPAAGLATAAELAPVVPAEEAAGPEPLEAAPRSPGPPRAALREGGALPSCESAAANAMQDLDFASGDRTADLPSSAIAGVLENGAWLSTCNVPASTRLGVCVAIKHGQVTAATVIARPADAALEACVKTRAAALQFPYSNRQDIARTQF